MRLTNSGISSAPLKPGLKSPKHLILAIAGLACALLSATQPVFAQEKQGNTYYVRSTIGDDMQDGRTPQSAWKTVARGARVLGPGDTLIIGPGLYREHVRIETSGLPDRPIRISGDPSGELTGDPPGSVMMSGSIPVEESDFEPDGAPGVYRIPSDTLVYGAVEMDGTQHRYRNVREPKSDVPYVQRVRNTSSTAWWEKDDPYVYIHTSDDKPPTEHEIELIEKHSAFFLKGASYVWFSDLTTRHYGDGTIYFQDGSDHGRVSNCILYGGRHGVRILGSKHVEILDNIMMLNENAGAYFLRQSENGRAVGNISYDNAVGLRWGSESSNGFAGNNVLVDNSDAGMGIEKVVDHIAADNLFWGNTPQLRVIGATFESNNNCFEAAEGSGTPFTATWDLVNQYASFEQLIQARGQELNSRTGDCGITFERLDVHKLHSDSLSYPDSGD